MGKIEIIAECGINWNGDIAVAEAMAKTAKVCGADVAKFQLFNAEQLIADRPEMPEYNKMWVRKTELSKDMLVKLKDSCYEYDIEFMCSVFSGDLVEWLEDIDVKRYKIPSPFVFDEYLCESVLATNKVIIMSDGFIQGPRYEKLPKGYICNFNRLRWLYCVSKYPTALEDINFPNFDQCDYSGFSDHTLGIIASCVAMSRGAVIIEKHFTFSKSMEGPDHTSSITPVELVELCHFRNRVEEILK